MCKGRNVRAAGGSAGREPGVQPGGKRAAQGRGVVRAAACACVEGVSPVPAGLGAARPPAIPGWLPGCLPMRWVGGSPVAPTMGPCAMWAACLVQQVSATKVIIFTFYGCSQGSTRVLLN